MYIFLAEEEVLQGVRWTEPLDMIFRENRKRDKTLKYQYFASPHGYMRHYPGTKKYNSDCFLIVFCSREMVRRTVRPNVRPQDAIVVLRSDDLPQRRLHSH